MVEQTLVGVVTVTFNSATVLPDFLRCMSAQSHRNFLLFAVDNASQDDTTNILRSCSDHRLKFVLNAGNLGVAEGNNQGIRAALEAGCSAVLLINNDTEFETELVAKLLEALDTYDAEIVCPKMMYYDQPDRIWCAGGEFLPSRGYMSICYGENEIDRGQHDRVRVVTDVPTCCVLIKKRVFDIIGLMDERYFVYVDDSDFMYRAMKAGVRMIYFPGAKLLHKVSSLTGGGESQFAIHYATRNRVFFQLKYFGVLRTLPWILARELTWFAALAAGRKDLTWFRRKNAAVRSAFALERTTPAERHSAPTGRIK
jgi:GT2 family glycosyltransferase